MTSEILCFDCEPPELAHVLNVVERLAVFSMLSELSIVAVLEYFYSLMHFCTILMHQSNKAV